RLLLFDSTLTRMTVVADSAGTGATGYGRLTNLIHAPGDSVFSVDFPSQTLVLRGPGGAIVRSVAPPKVQDFTYLLNGTVALDARGGLVYRGVLRPPPRVPGTPPAPTIDSVPLVRGDFDTRRVDTIAMIKVRGGAPPMQVVRGADNKITFKEIINPISMMDEWAMLADG